MILSRRYWWSKDFKYIVSLGIKKKTNRILLSFVVVKLNADLLQNKTLLQSYYNSYLSDRNNIALLDNLSSITTVFDQDYGFESVKKLMDVLVSLERQNRNQDTILLNFGNNVRVTLTYTDLFEIIEFIKSYYQNYNIIDAIVRLILINCDGRNKESIDTQKATLKATLTVNPDKKRIGDVTKDNGRDISSNAINDDLQYIVTQFPFTVKQFLAHMFLTYCINVNTNNPLINYNDAKKISITNPFMIFRVNNLLYGKFFIDKIISIITLCIKEIDNEIVEYLLKHIVMNYITDQQKFNLLIPPLKLLIILQFILIALVKTSKTDENSYNYIITNIDKILHNHDDILSRILTYAISSTGMQILINNNVDNINTENNTDIVDKDQLDSIIKEYEHVKPIDENKFVSLVLKKYDEYKNENEKNEENNIIIPLGETKIIDITQINDKQNSMKSPVIKIINDTFDNAEIFPILSYALDKEYITDLYQDFINFLNDETSILVKLNDDRINSIHKSIYKTFPVIKTFIENHHICQSKLTSILDLYYEIVKSNEFKNLLKSLFTNQILLVIIFQIFIPYFYHKFGQKQFVDNLL